MTPPPPPPPAPDDYRAYAARRDAALKEVIDAYYRGDDVGDSMKRASGDGEVRSEGT